MTEHERFSDELLNAYVDGELDADDRLSIDQAIEDDERLRKRVHELQEMKRLVRSAYVDERPARAPVIPMRRVWITRVAASAAIFALGAVLSWGWLSYTGGLGDQQVASAPSARQSASPQIDEVKVLFHVSRDDPELLNDVLNEAEALLATTGQRGDSAVVRIIASGSGLTLFEKSSAANPERISGLKRSYQERIVFNGCGVAYKQFKSQEADGEFELLPEVKLVDLGVLELMRRQRAGWAYVRL